MIDTVSVKILPVLGTPEPSWPVPRPVIIQEAQDVQHWHLVLNNAGMEKKERNLHTYNHPVAATIKHQKMLLKFTEVRNGPCTVQCNNTAVCEMAATCHGTKHQKFVYISHHFIQETIQQHNLQIAQIAKKSQKSDMFTRPLGRTDFERQSSFIFSPENKWKLRLLGGISYENVKLVLTWE